jgi:hypothetical protein
MYPLALVGCGAFMIKMNSEIMGKLDKKYTPIWLEISKKV